MTDPAAQINRDLEEGAPALFRALSPMGRRVVFPPDIPFQAAQAKGCEINGTIGVFTDGAGQAVPLPSIADTLELPAADKNRALLYSPVDGFPDVRAAWRTWQRRELLPGAPVSGLPVVTCGLTHSLALVADLFGGEGRVVAIPTPFWGNYRQVFGLRTGAVVRSAPGYRDGAYNPHAVAEALDDLVPGEPAVALLNFPSNPGGYSPTVAERETLVDSLVRVAERRPLVVLCDDAYLGLVYEEGIPAESIFWDLAGRHPDLVPVKVDGATKELAFFGGRVGFVTFAVEPDSAVQKALDSKLKCLIRAGIGSPVATSQMILLQALRSPSVDDEVAAVRQVATERYQAVAPALAALDRELLRPLPFNSGFFALLEIPEELGVSSEELRLHLIAKHSTGVVSIAPRYVRLATCSVAAAALPEMVARVERGLRELVGR